MINSIIALLISIYIMSRNENKYMGIPVYLSSIWVIYDIKIVMLNVITFCIISYIGIYGIEMDYKRKEIVWIDDVYDYIRNMGINVYKEYNKKCNINMKEISKIDYNDKTTREIINNKEFRDFCKMMGVPLDIKSIEMPKIKRKVK